MLPRSGRLPLFRETTLLRPGSLTALWISPPLDRIAVPSGFLIPDTIYYWRVRHQDSYYNWSSWSTETSFTTISLGPPNTPSNISPADGTTDISVTPTLRSSTFSTSHAGDPAASQWQITTVSGNYVTPAKIFDSNVDTVNLTQIAVPSGLLSINSTYYWRVRHQDSYGYWSDWSAETSFTTTAKQVPVTPSNISPVDGATGVSLTLTLTSSAFSDPDVGDSHKASQWQIREATSLGDYSVTVFDSLTDTLNMTAITVPAGKLSYNTAYYWRVRHQDSYGNWSGWSTETSFTTVASAAPHTPSNIWPADGTIDISLTPTLLSSAFSDPDAGDFHYASWWQITTIPGDYAAPAMIFDSGLDTINLTWIVVPSEFLSINSTYYWRVRHQDSYGNWSGWSTETSFTTAASGAPRSAPDTPVNISPLNGATVKSLTPTLSASDFSDPDPGDDHLASQWQITIVPGDYSSPVFDSSVDYTNLTTILIPLGRLGYGTTYYWRVRYVDNYGDWSNWSVETSFTTATSGPPDKPTNISPADGTTDISLTPTLESSAFITSHPGDHAASQWQITTISGNYVTPAKIFDSNVDTINLTQIAVPSGLLSINSTYYWRVRHQDNYGYWSDWSAETSFTTTAKQVPVTPSNISPANGATGVSLTPTLTSSAFSDPDVGDSHKASQWQIRRATAPGDYSVTVYDSLTDTVNKTAITVPAGKLSYNTTYYWRVRHQDSYGNWSGWSTETSFTTVASGVPRTPVNISPANGTTSIILTPTLQSSAFSDPDAGDIHYASQWQITRISGNYSPSNVIFDSGVDLANLTEIAIPSGVLTVNTTYYWCVRYQDDKGYWSNWSVETSFKTIVSGNPGTPINMSPVNGATNVALTPTLQSSAFVSPDGAAIHNASQWQITTTSGSYIPPAKIFDSDVDTINLTQIDIPSGLLTVNTTYYWRVRHQDSYLNWSDWSVETRFTTTPMQVPVTPSNISPASGATGISLTPTLTGSAFSDPDVGDSHKTSRWQIRTSSGSYASPAYDSGLDTINKTSISIPAGKLSYNTTYYWRVRYQDSYGNWSGWSTETSFTTVPSGAPRTPSNVSPANGTTDIILTPSLQSSPFSDPDLGDVHYASQWQITTTSGSYDTPAKIFDSGVDIINLTKIDIPSGLLSVNNTYYWRVRHQDDRGYWSSWSAETRFTTTPMQVPVTPSNISPVDGATGVSLTPTLTSSAFSDPDVGDSHKASQWQIRTGSGSYASPAYDSGLDTINKTSISIPAGKLSHNTAYYWRVRHQDSYGNWSGWSTETSFTTVPSGAPRTPSNVSPANGTTDIILTPTLHSAPFSDPDLDDIHYASQWQVTTASGDYDPPAKIFDSGVDTINLMRIALPSGVLSVDTTYWWRVRHQDSYGNWSSWSTETSFTTTAMQVPVTPSNISPANGATGVSLVPTLTSSAFSDPDVGDSHKASQWQIREANAPSDYSITVYDSLADSINKTAVTVPTGKLSYYSTYYWHVRYQDSHGNWSGWSTETSFATVASGAPHTPVNVSPANGTAGIILTPTLRVSDFSDDDPGDIHFASQWQIRTGSETFDSPMLDSGVDTSNLTQIAMPSGYLEYGTTYYWRVRHQDSYGRWSAWSAETFFTTAIPRSPNQPTTVSPLSGATGVSLTPTLRSSVFSARDAGDSHRASQWQIRTEAGTFDSPVFDSGIDTVNLTRITIPEGELDYGTTYYWRVRHQNRYGSWSAYSVESLFSTIMPPPQQPDAISPLNGAVAIILTPTLESSIFVSRGVGATHAASQWQITAASGDYSSPVYDSGTDTINKTSIIVPSWILSENTKYYWRVRHQDNYGNWSGYSFQASFTTATSPEADFSVAPTTAVPGQTLTFTDTSTGDVTAWLWDFGDGTTAEWTTTTRPEDGKITHRYPTLGNYTVTVKLIGPIGENTKTKVITIRAPAPAPSGGKGFPWVPVVVGVVVVLAAGGAFWYLRRR